MSEVKCFKCFYSSQKVVTFPVPLLCLILAFSMQRKQLAILRAEKIASLQFLRIFILNVLLFFVFCFLMKYYHLNGRLELSVNVRITGLLPKACQEGLLSMNFKNSIFNSFVIIKCVCISKWHAIFYKLLWIKIHILFFSVIKFNQWKHKTRGLLSLNYHCLLFYEELVRHFVLVVLLEMQRNVLKLYIRKMTSLSLFFFLGHITF